MAGRISRIFSGITQKIRDVCSFLKRATIGKSKGRRSDISSTYNQPEIAKKALVERSATKPPKKSRLEKLWGKKGNSIVPKTGLCKRTYMGLRLYRRSCKGMYMTKEQKVFLAKFLNYAVANEELNSELRNALDDNWEKLEEKDLLDPVECLSRFSYKTKALKLVDLNDVCDRSKSIMDQFDLGKKPSKREKLSHFELGCLDKAVDLFADFEFLIDDMDDLKYMSEVSALHKTLKLITRCMGEYKRINDAFKLDVSSKPKGHILFENKKKELTVERFGNITHHDWQHIRLVSRFGHAANLNVDLSGEVELSHITAGYEVNHMNIIQASYSTVFRFDASRLTRLGQRGALKKAYKDNWKNVIQEKFEAAMKRMTDIYKAREAKDMDVVTDNSYKRREKAGRAKYGFEGGYKKSLSEEKTDFKQLQQKMYFRDDESPSKDMICTEFVAKTTIAALMEVEGEIVQDMKEKGINYKRPKTGLSFMRLPINARERLEHVHPGRLYALLRRAGCIKSMPPSPIQKALLKNP